MSIFSKIRINKPKENTFDLSHERKFSFNIGELIPCLLLECVPGDKFTINTAQLMRFAPILAPIMHQVSLYVHYWFVPNRLVWSNWEDFITGGEDGTADPAFPYFETVYKNGELSDYLGLPDSSAVANYQVSAIPFADYNFIFNEMYRDQNLIAPQPYELSDGDNTLLYDEYKSIRNRAWQHDYFTSALPWTQKGDEATIPLGTTAPLNYSPSGVGSFSRDPATGNLLNTGANADVQNDLTTAILEINNYSGGATDQVLDVDNTNALSVDLSSATAATINDLRTAFRIQEWLEKNARGGSRYIEAILVHFGVKSSDARLQRPEYLGGYSAPVVISEVLQTSSTDATTPQGNMAGHGLSVGANAPVSYFCEEHGYIMGIVSVLPKTAYQQGIPKHFMKFDKFDYYFPTFAHLGEQPILNKEIWLEGDATDDQTFGYTPRYSEYKFMSSTVHGDFRTTLDFWHMGRIFADQPVLSGKFISCDAEESARVFAVNEGGDNLWCQMLHNIKATRRMPYFGTPYGV